MKQVMKKTLAAALAAAFLTTGQGMAATLEEERDSYDAQVEELGRQSDELAGKIDSLSEQKRILDEAADEAIAEHKARRAELNATLERLEENEEKLEVAERDYDRKSDALGKRVRDIYINGQISYVDVLFG
ncbi:MAG: peptidase M23, partial [Centipeda sp. (in: firmicutes)]